MFLKWKNKTSPLPHDLKVISNDISHVHNVVRACGVFMIGLLFQKKHARTSSHKKSKTAIASFHQPYLVDVIPSKNIPDASANYLHLYLPRKSSERGKGSGDGGLDKTNES